MILYVDITAIPNLFVKSDRYGDYYELNPPSENMEEGEHLLFNRLFRIWMENFRFDEISYWIGFTFNSQHY